MQNKQLGVSYEVDGISSKTFAKKQLNESLECNLLIPLNQLCRDL